MWRVEFSAKADKQFGKLDSQTQQAVVDYLERVIESGDPQLFGKPLLGDWSGFWRYRVGKHRLICMLENKKLVIEVITIGKRDHIYG